jgi:hypothetical protein
MKSRIILMMAALAMFAGAAAAQSADPCQRYGRLTAVINQTANAQVIALSTGNYTYICSIDLVTATAQNIALVEGTGSTCGTSTQGIAGGATAATGWNLVLGGFIIKGTGEAWVFKSNSKSTNICILQSSTGQVSGSIQYVQHPF